jgi:hypothetical protein
MLVVSYPLYMLLKEQLRQEKALGFPLDFVKDADPESGEGQRVTGIEEFERFRSSLSRYTILLPQRIIEIFSEFGVVAFRLVERRAAGRYSKDFDIGRELNYLKEAFDHMIQCIRQVFGIEPLSQETLRLIGERREQQPGGWGGLGRITVGSLPICS